MCPEVPLLRALEWVNLFVCFGRSGETWTRRHRPYKDLALPTELHYDGADDGIRNRYLLRDRQVHRHSASPAFGVIGGDWTLDLWVEARYFTTKLLPHGWSNRNWTYDLSLIRRTLLPTELYSNECAPCEDDFGFCWRPTDIIAVRVIADATLYNIGHLVGAHGFEPRITD